MVAVPLPPQVAVVAIRFGTRHRRASGEYRTRREECDRPASVRDGAGRRVHDCVAALRRDGGPRRQAAADGIVASACERLALNAAAIADETRIKPAISGTLLVPSHRHVQTAIA